MVSLKSLAVAAFAVLAVASPVEFDKRQSSSVRCGSTTYSAAQLRSATNAGCSYHFNGQQIGTNKYPHTFNNREGLSFAVSGPYQEFPIVPSGVYNGSSPGADRVVFTPGSGGQCAYAGAITHTGASGNNFVSCI